MTDTQIMNHSLWKIKLYNDKDILIFHKECNYLDKKFWKYYKSKRFDDYNTITEQGELDEVYKIKKFPFIFNVTEIPDIQDEFLWFRHEDLKYFDNMYKYKLNKYLEKNNIKRGDCVCSYCVFKDTINEAVEDQKRLEKETLEDLSHTVFTENNLKIIMEELDEFIKDVTGYKKKLLKKKGFVMTCDKEIFQKELKGVPYFDYKRDTDRRHRGWYTKINYYYYRKKDKDKKDAIRKIEDYYLKAKYNPKTKIGKKFINKLYDENFQ